MKKLKGIIAGLALSLVIGVSIAGVVKAVGLDEMVKVEVVEENGFKVLKDDNENEQKIVCQVIPHEDWGFKKVKGESVCRNVFDETDVIVIDEKETYDLDQVLLVTFENDDVVDVKLNYLNIGDKVSGQVIN